MNLNDANKLMIGELSHWRSIYPTKLAGWTCGWNQRKRHFGLCRFREKRIELSAPMTAGESDSSRVLDTIRHEIAHALAGHAAGHGPEWRFWATKVGATPERCGEFGDEAIKPMGAYQVCFNHPNGHVEVIYELHQYPRTNYAERYIKGRKAETLGKLYVRHTPMDELRANRLAIRAAASK